jgi:hypothetical protein
MLDKVYTLVANVGVGKFKKRNLIEIQQGSLFINSES